jgi:hypothetical protein
MLRRLGLLLSALLPVLLLGGCGEVSVRGVDAAVTTQMKVDADRMIVVAVANPAENLGSHVGSTLRGYDPAASYPISDRAQATLDALASHFELNEVAAWPIAALRLHCAVFRISSSASREEVLAALARDRRVQIAEPLQTFDTLGSTTGSDAGAGAASSPYNDPYLKLQRGFAEVDAGEAQQWSQGEGVRVAIIDTGVDTTHEDLAGQVVVARNFVDGDHVSFRGDRHGTEVAGLIAAVANNHQGIVGVAPRVKLIALKACWQLRPDADAAQCNSFTLAEALGAAIDAGAQVINLSLGGPADPLLSELVRHALARGIIVTGAVPAADHSAASGPSASGQIANAPTANGFPNGIAGVIAVDRSDHIDAGERIVHAPGSEVLTLTPGGHYDFVSGSSFATAHASGVIALLLARSPHMSAADILSLLLSTSTPDVAGNGPAGATSINACAALSLLEGRAGCGSPSARLSPQARRSPAS